MEKQMIMKKAEQDKAQTILAIDQHAAYGNMQVDDNTIAELMYVQEESAKLRLMLDQQAAGLTLDYQQRMVQESVMSEQYKIQKSYYDNSQKLQAMQLQLQQGVVPQSLSGMGGSGIAAQGHLDAQPITVSQSMIAGASRHTSTPIKTRSSRPASITQSKASQASVR